MFVVVCFDIVDDRVRHHAVKIIKDYGYRVQKSVFECQDLSEEKFLKMKNRLEDVIDHGEDTVRYYPICKGCVGRVELSGIGIYPKTGTFKIV